MEISHQNNTTINTPISLSGPIAKQASPNTLGSADCSAELLEQEIANNNRLTVTAENGILFHNSEQKGWQQAPSLLGIDTQFISYNVGYA